jgi:hypothetical protein
MFGGRTNAPEPSREKVLSMQRQSGESDLIPSKQAFSFRPPTVGCDLILSSQVSKSFSNIADHDSIPSTQIYAFTHQIASRDSILSNRKSEHFSDSDNSGSIPSQQDFSWLPQMSNVNPIPSESVSLFSSEQGLMCSQ